MTNAHCKGEGERARLPCAPWCSPDAVQAAGISGLAPAAPAPLRGPRGRCRRASNPSPVSVAQQAPLRGPCGGCRTASRGTRRQPSLLRGPRGGVQASEGARSGVQVPPRDGNRNPSEVPAPLRGPRGGAGWRPRAREFGTATWTAGGVQEPTRECPLPGNSFPAPLRGPRCRCRTMEVRSIDPGTATWFAWVGQVGGRVPR
jgi:hypothetical protein